MKLIEDLLRSVADLDFEVKRVCIGLHWTAIESRFVGMAHTYKTSRKVEVGEAGDLVGRSALALAARMRSWEPLEASVGLAALNSLIEPSGSPGNVFEEILRIAPGRTVTIIGRFPSNEQVVAVAGKTYLLEMEPERGELPPSAAEEVVPQSDVTVISATALINKTLPRLLDLGRQGITVVLGPSTPMNGVLLDHGAAILAGTRVTNTDALMSSIMQGAKSFNRLAGIEPLVFRLNRHTAGSRAPKKPSSLP